MIFTLLNNVYTVFSSEMIKKSLNDNPGDEKKENINEIGLKIIMNDNENTIIQNNIVLLCNGEIYNSRELFYHLGIEPNTEHSFEIIIPLYQKYGMEYTLQLLDGVFSFFLLDNNIEIDNFKLYVARDPYGIKPLYILNPIENNHKSSAIIGFSSNKNVLNDFYNSLSYPSNKSYYEVKQFLPGTYSSYILPSKVLSCWLPKKEYSRYYHYGFNSLMYEESSQYDVSNIVKNIQIFLIRAIEKRFDLYKNKNDKIKFLCYLDGSIGSSILAGLMKQYCIIHQLSLPETYSIESAELNQGKQVAEYLDLKHTEIIIKKEDIHNEIFCCKKETECYYKMTCSPSDMENYAIYSLLIKKIEEQFKPLKNSNSRRYKNDVVLFLGNGCNIMMGEKIDPPMNHDSIGLPLSEGDESLGSTLSKSSSIHCSPKTKIIEDPISFDYYTKKQLTNMYLNESIYTVLERHQISYCCPFLDTSFVNYFLSIPPQIRFNSSKEINTFFLRLAFFRDYYVNTDGKDFLPDEILWGMYKDNL